MLSKPKSAPSLGSSSVTSMSSAEQIANRVAVLGAVQAMHHVAARRRCALPRRDRASPASQLVKPTYSASVGCGVPWGGIARTLSLRSTRSHVAALGSRSSRLADSRFTGSIGRRAGVRLL